MKSSTWYFLVWCIGFSLITTGLSQLEVVGQKEPIVALVGDDVILPCSLSSSTSVVDETVEWQRRDLTPKEVHYYSDRRDNPNVQNPVYRGRTRLFEEELKSGNMSLKLTGVKHTDNGFFTCFVPKLVSTVKTSVIQLIVGAVSKPVISIVGPKDYGVVLKCDSGGWYPEPEMTWLDSDGNILPDRPTETETDSDGRYTVKGHVTIQNTGNNMFTCRVLQHQINHKMETEIHVPGGVFPLSRGQKAGVIIGVLALLAVAVLVGLCMWRKQKKREAELKRKKEQERTKAELEKTKAELEKTKAELEKMIKKLEKREAELEIMLEQLKKREAELGRTPEQKTELEKMIKKLEKMIKMLKKREAELKKTKAELDKWTVLSEKREAELKKTKAELDKWTVLSEKREAELKVMRRQMKKGMEEMRREMEEMRREMEEIKRKMENKDEIFADKDKHIAEMRRQMEYKDGIIEYKDGIIEEMRKEMEEMRKEMVVMDGEIDELTERLYNSEGKQARLMKRLRAPWSKVEVDEAVCTTYA